MSEQNRETKNVKQRPPIVVILGHVDHGKTSILDFIRQSKVAEKESGGITQHIGAYQIDHQGKIITFLDTPGHEAFSAMRSRGAKVADIAILVVAADDGVKPQTKEAISLILHLGLPVIVAVNKMDKPAALPQKVYKELADNGLLVEASGGQVPAILLSAKTGLNINELLEMILLVAEMENFTGDDEQPANGIVIESRMDSKRGATATLLVQNGTLRLKDTVAAESTFGQIRSMENFLGQNITQAPSSTPVLITGLSSVPPVGEEWQVMASLDEAKKRVDVKAQQEKKKREPAEVLDITEGKKVFNLILKADVSGSLEAIREALKTIPQEEIALRIIKAEVGDVTENDVKLAESAKAKIYGFRIKSQSAADKLADNRHVKIGLWQVIYELIQTVRQDASVLLPAEIIKEKTGRLKVLAVFKGGAKQIIGGRVTTGKIERGRSADVYRNEEFIGTGKITQLQQNKENAQEVTKDKECGIQFEGDTQLEKNDILETYKEERAKREL